MIVIRRVLAGLAVLLLAGCATGQQSSGPAAVSSATRGSSSHSVAADGQVMMVDLIVAASTKVAYVLTGIGPTGEVHTALYRTSDSGAHFRRVMAPTAVSRTGQPLPTRVLTFVDPVHGYAILGDPQVSRRSVFLSTLDGGQSWQRVRLPGIGAKHVDSVSGHGREVFAASIRCHGRLRCNTVTIYTSRVGSSRWHNAGASLPSRDSSSGVGLTAWDSSVWLMLGVASSRHPLTLHSDDSARTFTPIGATYAVSCHPMASSPHVIWTACSTGMLVAFDRTAGQEPPQPLPVGGAGTGGTFLDPLSDDLAYFGTALGPRAGLYLTRNAGRTFTKTARIPRRLARSATWSRTTFLDTRFGLTTFNGRDLFRTTDGGHSWRTVRLGTT